MIASTSYINSGIKYTSDFSDNIEDIKSETYGGKAYWINWLSANGYNVPKSFFISHELSCEDEEVIEGELYALFDKVAKDFRIGTSLETVKLAVRSSSTVEDGFSESKAGNFDSFLGIMDRKEFVGNYNKVVKSQRADKCGKMGVIVQELIDPMLSGVVFSSNPLNFSKEEVLLSIVEGYGDKLMSGSESGTDIVMNTSSKTCNLGQYDEQINSLLMKILEIAKEVENKLNYPVDIEWVIDKNLEIVIIQTRPINNFILKENRIDLVSKKNMESINRRLIDSDKVRLRLKAEEFGVPISSAYLLTLDCQTPEDQMTEDIDRFIDSIQRSSECVGYSAVILSPRTLDEKIMRAFTGNTIQDIYETFEAEERQDIIEIVSYPKYEDLKACIKAFVDSAKESYWSISVIIQEIYSPKYTGIMNKSENQYIVEATKGHFASKGILPMSRYIVKRDEILDFKETTQDKVLCIREGYVYEKRLSENERSIELKREELLEIVNKFKGFYRENTMIEFGLSDQAYLIDTFSIDMDKKITESCIREISEGIICPGPIEGRLVKLDVSNEYSINMHFLNTINNHDREVEKTVFYSKYPDISFLSIIEKYDNKNISFLFEEGSVLCHFSILLRERDIPSIVGYDIEKLVEGEKFEL